jgi:hypothetical protein
VLALSLYYIRSQELFYFISFYLNLVLLWRKKSFLQYWLTHSWQTVFKVEFIPQWDNFIHIIKLNAGYTICYLCTAVKYPRDYTNEETIGKTKDIWNRVGKE